ncbi:MAG: acyltransferase family protein [Rhizobacter sp.]
MDTPTSTRRVDLDWIRIAAFGVLIVYHVGMYYVSWDWHVKSPHAGTTIEPLMMLSSPWRLSLLFFVSGTAASFALARGHAGFAGARSRRLLIPIVFGMLVIVVPQAYFEVVEKLGYRDGYLAFYARYLTGDHNFCPTSGCLRLPTWNHLWFVVYLWAYSMVLVALVAWLPGLLERAGARLARAFSGIGVLLWPALLLVLWRVLLVGRFPSTHALIDDGYNHALYGSVFLLGFLLARHDAVWESLRARRWLALGLAAASYAFVAWYFAAHFNTAPSDAPRTVQRVIYAVNQWTALAAVLGFARQWAPGDSPARRYLTAAVFPFYILHQTVIVVLAHGLKPLALAPAVEGPLLVAATFAACFAGFELIRRVRWLRPLFGLPLQARQPRASTVHTASTTPRANPPLTTT